MIEKLTDPRFLVSIIVMGIFAWAFAANPTDDTMKGSLIAGFAGAWGFWLGSSKGAQSQTENVGKALDLANTNTPPAAAKAEGDQA